MMKNAIQNPNAEIEDIERLVGEALERAGAGGAVNLSDLDDRANRLCEYLLALPALEARPYAARLESLIDRMNALEDAMAANYNALSSGVGPFGPVLQANR